MFKRVFAASIVSAGILAAFCGGNVFAFYSSESYTPGEKKNFYSGDIDVCIYKIGGYTGDTIIANVSDGNFNTQLSFDSFSEDEKCTHVFVPSGGGTNYVSYYTPMGLGNLNLDKESLGSTRKIKLNLEDSTTLNKYISSNGSFNNRIGASKIEIQFDANGGTGTMPSMTNLDPNTNITLDSNSLTRTDYKFVGWNTKADGTGTSYADGETITLAKGGIVKLYAQWTPAVAILDKGENVNKKIKKLAGASGTVYSSTDDQNVKAIIDANSLPSGFDANDSNYIISASDSLLKIYAWFDDTDNDGDGVGDGITYVYTEANIIRSGTDLAKLLRNFQSLSNISALASWDVSNAKTFEQAFYETAISDISPLASWDTSSATNFTGMFDNTNITNLDALETKQYPGNNYVSWDVSNVENMGSMFASDSSLSDISALSSWNTSNVENLSLMFMETGVTNLDALETKQYPGNDYVSWDVSNVVSTHWMFLRAGSLSDISALSSWNTSNVENLSLMFLGTGVTNLDALETKQYPGNNYVSWDVSNVTDMGGMFGENSHLTDISALRSWNTSSVTDMDGMFGEAQNLSNISALASWDVSGVEKMFNMFRWTAISDISPLASWDTSSATDLSAMFENTNIANLNALETKQHTGNDYVSWDVSNVKNIRGMFAHNTSLSDISALSSWNTSNMNNVSQLFWGSNAITNLDALETKQYPGNNYVSWDVSNVTNMSNMFREMNSLADISALSSWNISSVTDMSRMFYHDICIVSLSPISNWAVSTSVAMTSMFDNIPTSVTRPAWYH